MEIFSDLFYWLSSALLEKSERRKERQPGTREQFEKAPPPLQPAGLAADQISI
jgi:hypothetical protein